MRYAPQTHVGQGWIEKLNTKSGIAKIQEVYFKMAKLLICRIKILISKFVVNSLEIFIKDVVTRDLNVTNLVNLNIQIFVAV